VWKETNLEDVGKELERLGIGVLGNRCKLIREDDVAGATIIFAMDRNQKAELERRFPKFSDRIEVLGEFANLKDPRIYDLPEEPSPRKTVEKIRRALEEIKKKKLIENRKE
jgi:protein-tyrosine-phosphatase